MGAPLKTRIFKAGSVTYFTASLFFPPKIRDAVFTLYAFVRVADNYVDATPQDAAGFYAFVADYRSALAGGSAKNPVISDFVALQQAYALPQVWIDAFLQAMESDLYKSKYETLDELLLYMYGSAEVIGLLLCRCMGVSPAGYGAARELGRAMQYANFLRDIATDTALGRQYIPQEILEKYGLPDLDESTIRENSSAFQQLFRAEVERYTAWNQAARTGFCLLPRSVRAPIAAASEMYTWTLAELRKEPMRVLDGSLKPERLQVAWAVFREQLALR